MSRKIKILIVEPSVVISVGLDRILSLSGRYEVLPVLADAENLAASYDRYRPDVMLINPTILPYTKRQSVRSLLPEHAHVLLVAIVYQYVEPSVLKAYNAIMDIREPEERIVQQISESVESFHSMVKNEGESYELTERETAVLVLVAKGMMSKEIAEKLNISVHTVISHRKNITLKTGNKSVAGLAVYAVLHNLMDME